MSRVRRLVYKCDGPNCSEFTTNTWDDASYYGWMTRRSPKGLLRHFCSYHCCFNYHTAHGMRFRG